MKVNILYDKYNTKIQEADIIFENSPDTTQSIKLEVIQKDIGIEDVEEFIDHIEITSIDSDSIEIVNEMNKDDLRVFLSVVRNLLTQMK